MDFDESGWTNREIDFFVIVRKKYIIDIIVFNKYSVRNNYQTLRNIVEINIKNAKAKMIRTKRKTTKWNLSDYRIRKFL
jgi:hypothetical protein